MKHLPDLIGQCQTLCFFLFFIVDSFGGLDDWNLNKLDVSPSVHQSPKPSLCLLQTSIVRSQCCRQNLDALLKMFLHAFGFLQTCCRHQHKRAWWWRAVMKASWQPSETDCLGRAPSAILSCKTWLQVCGRLPMVPERWQDKQMVLLGCRVLGTAKMELGLAERPNTRALSNQAPDRQHRRRSQY